MKVLDIKGKICGWLEVTGPHNILNGRVYWYAKCSCGKSRYFPQESLKYHRAKSCGCKRGVKTHGESDSPIYDVYVAMVQRCTNPNNRSYKNYGGRGITIDPTWSSFEKFYEDMGSCPKGFTLERVDNNGPYSKENCKWATRTEQNRNTRANRFVEIGGVTKTISQWAESSGLPSKIISYRLNHGFPFEMLLSPLKKKRTFVEYNGSIRSIREWEMITGIPKQTLTGRLRRGLSIDDVFKTTRVNSSKDKK
jgi:hypothetical protein